MNQMEQIAGDLALLAEKFMHIGVNPEHLAYCPTMDLLAIATLDQQVHVYRINGQRVFGLYNKENSKICGLAWKPNGQLLAVALEHGLIYLISAQTGKTVHQIRRPAHVKATICCLGWAVNVTDVSKFGQNSSFPDSAGFEDLLNADPGPVPSILSTDLPSDLASLDIDDSLPKLSILPAGNAEDEVFSSRASLDAIFHPAKRDSNGSADVLLVGYEDGTIHLSIYDFFEIGSFNLSDMPQKLDASHCYPEVKEWLVDELGERGHKRWDKAVSTGYENVRRLVHECLLPALERFSVIISRLRGLSRFQESTETLGLSTGELDDAFDTVSCLFLVAHDIQSSCSSELLQFTAFSAWMKLEIEIQATDPSSTSADDTAEKDGMLDHAKVLDYIQGPMHSSRILELLEIYSLSDARPGWNFAAEEKLMYPSFKNARKAHMTGGAPKIRLPGLASIIGRLDAQCQATFGKIAEAQRRKVRIGSSILLADDLPERIASRMVVKAMAPFDECQTYIATSQRNHLIIYRVTLGLRNGLSSTKTTSFIAMELPDVTIKDIKFVDDRRLIIAVAKETSSTILSILYQDLAYATVKSDRDLTTTVQKSTSVKITVDLSDTQRTFPEGLSWAPERLEVNGRKGRRALCILALDKIHYRLYGLDRPDPDPGGDDDDDNDNDTQIGP